MCVCVCETPRWDILTHASKQSAQASLLGTLVPGPVAFGQQTSTAATAAGTKGGVPGRAAAVAPVGGVSVAPTPAPAPAPAAAVGEDAAPRGDAGRAAAGTGAKVRDGSLSGTAWG